VAIEPAAARVEQSGGGAGRPGGRWRKDLLFFSIAVTIIVLDQFTKWLVRSNLDLYETWPEDGELFSIFGIVVRIIYVTNSGAAFGILQGQTTFLIVTSSLGLAAILLYYLYPPMDHGLIRIALGMQLGGAIGNLIDRVRLGAVTDFVDVGDFPTFNVADAAISTSIVAILIFFLTQEIDDRPAQPAPSPPGASPPGASVRDD
jgi:signal peptidase II